MTKIFSAGTISGISFALLLASMFIGSSNLQARAQATGTDWWPMFRHDLNRTGASTSTSPTTNKTLWGFTTGGAVDSSPAVVDGVIYFGSWDRKVYCLNAANGAFIWNYTTGGAVLSAPAVVGGRVYVGSGDNVYCLNAANGAFIWRYTTGGYMKGSSPAVVDGLVYVGSDDHNVYCLNAVIGTLVWTYKTGYVVFSSPAVVDGVVYVGSEDGNIYAFGSSPPLTVSISPTSVTVDIGQSNLFTSNIFYGTSPYTYQWYLNGASVSGATGATWTFTPSSSGSYEVYVNVTDNLGVKAQSNTASVTVHALILSVSISPTSVTMDVGQSQTFGSGVSGGISPYIYQWCLNGTHVSGATDSTWTFTPASRGSYTVYANVTDNIGVTANSNVATVTANPAAEFPLYLIPLLVVTVILLAILLAVFVLRRKRNART